MGWDMGRRWRMGRKVHEPRPKRWGRLSLCSRILRRVRVLSLKLAF